MEGCLTWCVHHADANSSKPSEEDKVPQATKVGGSGAKYKDRVMTKCEGDGGGVYIS